MPWDDTIMTPSNQAAYWDSQSKLHTAVVTDVGAANLGFNRTQCVFTRSTPSGTREDTMVLSFAIGKQSGGIVSWTDNTSDLNNIQTDVGAWWTAIRTSMTTGCTFKEIRHYAIALDHLKSGPPMRVDAVAVAGTQSASQLPWQLAPTVTLVTASAKHWGRIYMPSPYRTAYDTTYGRFDHSFVDLWADAVRDLANALDGHGLELGVWSSTALSFLTLHAVQCDDVPDIQRRRRAKQRAYATTYTS